jgi:hypothetical protein
MNDCIGAQWVLYIEYIRKTLDYTIKIIPLTMATYKSLAAILCAETDVPTHS